MSNSFGRIFKITTYGESHGPAIGVVIDGCPAGVSVDIQQIQALLDKRRPGQSHLTTQRKEKDQLIVESGIFQGVSTGTPIHFRFENTDARSRDYSNIKDNYRPSHADFTYDAKYGLRDYRGGGRSSARETACRVAAGGLALQVLNQLGIDIHSFVSQVYNIQLKDDLPGAVDYSQIEKNMVRCPDADTAQKMQECIEVIKKEGETVGGTISCHIHSLPVGLGEPIYDKFQARLASGILSINACKGFEYGSGFSSSLMKGSEHNDIFEQNSKGAFITQTNHSGGIQGGITNGMPVYFRSVFKPVATVRKPQQTVSKDGASVELNVKGRHDPCVLPRAVPIVTAMAALVTLDFILIHRTNRI